MFKQKAQIPTRVPKKQASLTHRKIKKSRHTVPLTKHVSHFSSTTDPITPQILPKIPKITYLDYTRESGTFDVLPLLQERGFVSQTTNQIEDHFKSSFHFKSEHDTVPVAHKNLPKRSIYAGFDPTASSLHLGNLLVILSLMHFHNAGHQIIALTGGATGMIGDPSGRSTERVLQTAEQVKGNAAKIHQSLHKLITGNKIIQRGHENVENTPIFVDNFDWYDGMSVINFLRDVGKHFRVASMLSKDSVKSRLNTQDSDGISFTEFSYQVLQGYDFHHLFKKYNVTLQLGGSDQWGNITAGIDCINRISPKLQTIDTIKANKGKKDQENGQEVPVAPQAHGLTLPLLTTSNGVKFGKSMGNAIWLDQELTSSYQMYQYLLSTTDADCEKFLKIFTFIDSESIQRIMDQHVILPDARIPQRVLAAEVVRLLHGDEGIKQAIIATTLLFKDKMNVDMSFYTEGNTNEAADTTFTGNTRANFSELFAKVSLEDCLASLNGVHITHLPALDISTDETKTKLDKIDTHPRSVVNMAVAMGLVASKAEAKRLIKNGGLYIFNDKITEDYVILPGDVPYQRLVILKAGQKKVHIGVLPQ